MKKNLLWICLCFLLAGLPGTGHGGIYQYTDENGVLRFTDTPQAGPDGGKRLENTSDGAPDFLDIRKALIGSRRDKHPGGAGVEQASLCVVTINSDDHRSAGFFISPDGYILTNKSQIAVYTMGGQILEDTDEMTGDGIREEKPPHEYKITLLNDMELKAVLVMTSTAYDLALLKADACIAPYIEPAAPGAVQIGDIVYAIGAPMPYRDFASRGTITEFIRGYIRTDAGIHAQNCGGPLINQQGQVVGISVMSGSSTGSAIPIQAALNEFKDALAKND